MALFCILSGGAHLILKHRKMDGVLVLTVLTISSLELRGGGTRPSKQRFNTSFILELE